MAQLDTVAVDSLGMYNSPEAEGTWVGRRRSPAANFVVAWDC